MKPLHWISYNLFSFPPIFRECKLYLICYLRWMVLWQTLQKSWGKLLCLEALKKVSSSRKKFMSFNPYWPFDHYLFILLHALYRLSTGALSRLILSSDSLRSVLNEYRVSKVKHLFLSLNSEIHHLWISVLITIWIPSLHVGWGKYIYMKQYVMFFPLFFLFSNWQKWLLAVFSVVYRPIPGGRDTFVLIRRWF